MNKAIELTKKRADIERKSAELMSKLTVSLGIQNIWPEAFESGQTCSLCANKRMKKYPSREMEICNTHLKRRDGVTFPITVEQYEELRK